MSEKRGTFSLSSGSSQIGKRLASCDNVLHRAIFYLPLPILSAKTKSYYEFLNLKKYFKLVATLFFILVLKVVENINKNNLQDGGKDRSVVGVH